MMEPFLQNCVAMMAVLGTILLGLEQHDWLLPILTIFVAVTSVIYTDRKRWFAIPRPLANLIAILAVMYTVVRLVDQPTESQLLAVANLLVYLQVVLFYQQKTIRLYWQLLTLSFLQVVVAAALNLVFIFGILLILYLFIALAALSAFYLHRESQMWLATGGSSWPTTIVPLESSVREGTRLRTGRAGRRDLTWKTISWQATWLGLLTLVATAVIFFFLPRHGSFWKSRTSRGQRTVGFSEEIQLEALGPILESPEMVMRVSFSNPLTNQPYRIWGEPYFRGAVLTEYVAGKGNWRRRIWETSTRPLPSASSLRNLVRQDITMEPGERSVVFTVPPVSAVRETPSDVLLESNSLTVVPKDEDRIDPKSKYRFVAMTGAFQQGIQLAMLPDDPHPSEVRHCRAFDNNLRETLPSLTRIAQEVLAAAKVDQDDQLGKVRALEAHFLAANRYQYSLKSSPKRNRSIDPIEDFVGYHHSGHCEYFASALALMLRSQGIPARVVIGYKGGEFNSVGNYYQVRQLHAHAWVECYFTPQQLRDIQREKIDEATEAVDLSTQEGAAPTTPVAVGNPTDSSKSLVEIIAAVDVAATSPLSAPPAATNVETPAEIENNLPTDSGTPTSALSPPPSPDLASEVGEELDDEFAQGGWLRLDPTPDAGDPLEGIKRSGLLGRLGHLADYAQLLWNDYVLGLDSQRQREAIYRPLVSGARATLEGLLDRGAWESWWASVMSSLGLSESMVRGPANYIIRIAIGLTLSVLLLAFLFRRQLGGAWGALRRMATLRWRTSCDADDFYRRLERLLARVGAVRTPGQTPRELAQLAQPLLTDSPYSHLPASVVEAFYRIRFGGQSLDKVESEQLQQALTAWERDLPRKAAKPTARSGSSTEANHPAGSSDPLGVQQRPK